MHHGNHIDDMAIPNTQHPTHLEFPNSTPLLRFTNQSSQVDHHLRLRWTYGKKISSFVDTLLQPIPISQESYEEDTTDFIKFIEKTRMKIERSLQRWT